jgi:hypothetical protein
MNKPGACRRCPCACGRRCPGADGAHRVPLQNNPVKGLHQATGAPSDETHLSAARRAVIKGLRAVCYPDHGRAGRQPDRISMHRQHWAWSPASAADRVVLSRVHARLAPRPRRGRSAAGRTSWTGLDGDDGGIAVLTPRVVGRTPAHPPQSCLREETTGSGLGPTAATARPVSAGLCSAGAERGRPGPPGRDR